VEERFFFQHDGTRLFAVLHPTGAPGADVGVVFCHPYAEERQLVDRVLVRFARRLAATGFAVVRFDCRGYGESQGELEDSTLETQIADTLAATALLRERLQVRSVVLLGLRLGGTVAALAAERDPAIAGVVLWSPIVSGRVYARELLRQKLAGQLALQEATATRDEIVATLKADGRIEFEGGYLTLRMFEDISAIDLARQVKRSGIRAFVNTIQHRSQNYGPYDALVNAYRTAGASADLVVAEAQEYWDVRSMFDGVFPEQLYTATLDWMGARWPARR
jgi:exosortase A-associated hydrolase 2